MGELTKATGFDALSKQEQTEHRARIGVRAQAILEQFWMNLDTPDVVRAVEMETWQDALQVCSHSEIRSAWQAYMADSANRTERGRLCKPDPMQIRNIVFLSRPKPKVEPVARIEEKPRVRVSTEIADQIVSELGFGGVSAPKRMTQANGGNEQ